MSKDDSSNAWFYVVLALGSFFILCASILFIEKYYDFEKRRFTFRKQEIQEETDQITDIDINIGNIPETKYQGI